MRKKGIFISSQQLLIFLVRHGRTEFNKKKIFRGHLDIPLDEVGKREAEATGKFLQDVNLSVIYSSPLKRALQTAKIIKKYQGKNLEVVPHPGLLDLSYGEWEGKTYKKIKETYPEFYQKWEKEPHRVKIPEGETLLEAKRRSCQALQQIISQHKSCLIALVSHRVINKLLLCGMLGIDESGFWRIKQDPCCINIVEYNNSRFTILRLNDTCHLSSSKENLVTMDF